jgi:hypothetical protein
MSTKTVCARCKREPSQTDEGEGSVRGMYGEDNECDASHGRQKKSRTGDNPYSNS